MGRFSAGKEAERDERQVKLKNLMDQLEKKKALLQGLTAKKHRKDTPRVSLREWWPMTTTLLFN